MCVSTCVSVCVCVCVCVWLAGFALVDRVIDVLSVACRPGVMYEIHLRFLVVHCLAHGGAGEI